MTEIKVPMTPLQRSYKGGLNAAYGAVTKELYVYLMPEDMLSDKESLRAVANKLIQAHPILGYKYEEGQTYEMVYNRNNVYFIGHACTDDLNDCVDKIFNEPLRYVFELWVIETGNEKNLAVKTDGMYFDGDSHNIFSSELEVLLYGGKVDTENDFITYAKKLSETDGTELSDEAKEYWKGISATQPPALPIVENTYGNITTAVIRQSVSENVYNNLSNIAARCNVTLFALLLTVFAKSLSLYSTGKEFMLNLPMSDRSKDSVKRNSIGLFADAMLFRFLDDGKSIAETAEDVQYSLMETFDFSELPITKIYRYIRSTGAVNFSAPVSFTDLTSAPKPTGKMKRRSTRVQTSQLWIEAIFERNETCYGFTLTYQCGVVPDFVADGIAEVFCSTLKSLAENTEKVLNSKCLKPKVSDIELIEKLNDTGEPICDRSLYELLMSSFESHADKYALLSESRTITYRELKQKAYSVGGTVRKLLNIYEGKPRVGILLPKGDRQIIAAVGCILSGIAYMPIENELTAETIVSVAKKAELSAVITDSSLADKLTESDIMQIPYDEYTETNGETSYPIISGDDIAVLINTSGTTGVPKSVLIKAKGIVNCLVHTKKLFGLGKSDRVLALTNFCHDMALFDTFGLLICGGAVVVPANNLQKDPEHWCALMDKFNVTVWNSVPVFLEMLAAYYESKGIIENGMLRCIDLGGDWIRPLFAEKALKMFPNAKIFSVGGPTETTIWNISHPITPEDCKMQSIPYGRPFPASKYFIFNDRFALCPIGIAGTMYVSGVGVSAGYAGNAEETEKRFITYEGCRYYNTGDNGMYLPDGTVRILGRSDFQIKISGKRIELTGIENAVIECADVSGAVCVLNKETGKLAVFVTSEKEINETLLRDKLAKKLPEYMLPSNIVRIDEFPVTRNGKIDRRALENKNISSNKLVSENTVELDHITKNLLEICRESLDNFEYDESLNFYIMGGDSLSSLGIIQKIRDRFGVELSVTEMMMYPSLNEWAELIGERSSLSDGTAEFLERLCIELFGKSAEDEICLLDTDAPQEKASKAAEEISRFTGKEINGYKLLAYPFVRDWASIISGGV